MHKSPSQGTGVEFGWPDAGIIVTDAASASDTVANRRCSFELFIWPPR
jgi:hypothetical protein